MVLPIVINGVIMDPIGYYDHHHRCSVPYLTAVSPVS